MRDSNRKLIYLLWTVIAALIVGGGIVGFMLIHKADDLGTTNDALNGDVSSLREQLRQAKASVSPTVTPAATTSTPSATPTPTASPARNR
jgi:hypothetical protein